MRIDFDLNSYSPELSWLPFLINYLIVFQLIKLKKCENVSSKSFVYKKKLSSSDQKLRSVLLRIPHLIRTTGDDRKQSKAEICCPSKHLIYRRKSFSHNHRNTSSLFLIRSRTNKHQAISENRAQKSQNCKNIRATSVITAKQSVFSQKRKRKAFSQFLSRSQSRKEK